MDLPPSSAHDYCNSSKGATADPPLTPLTVDIPSEDTLDSLMHMAVLAEKEIHQCISGSKLSHEKQKELRTSLANLIEICWKQQMSITKLENKIEILNMAKRQTLPTHTDVVSLSYATAVSSNIEAKAEQQKLYQSQTSHKLIIYPKTEIPSEETKTIIQKHIKPKNIKAKVNSVRNTKKGGIIINTPTVDDISKIIEEIKKQDSLCTKFTTVAPKPLEPSILLFGVPEHMDEETFIKELKESNAELEESKITIRTHYKTGYKSNWVFSLDTQSFKSIMKKDRIIFDWERLKFKENIRIKQCYNCGKYRHTAKECHNDELKMKGGICLRCGETGHKEYNCKKSKAKCVNCSTFNHKTHSHIDENHSSSDNKCPRRQMEISLLKNNIYYG